MAKHRMHSGLVALSVSAITAVYAVGYVHTQPVDALLVATPEAVAAAPVPSPTATATAGIAASPVPAASSRSRGSQSAPPAPAATATPSATAPPSAVASYRDGTYSGTGTSRFGNVEVKVTVQGGKIANVALTRVTTKYPASRIAALPGQVVARQSAQVDNVSGATASASAFRAAVQAALSRAA